MKKSYYKKLFILTIIFCLVMILDYGNKNTINKVENINLNKTLDLAAMTETINAIEYNNNYSVLDTFVGDLTGYGADCALCSGFLGCNSMDVRDGTIYFDDDTFGKVRIVAASRNLPCGSIITFKSSRVPNGEIVAIVLDRGVGGTSIDLLTESEEYAGSNIGRSQITYDVLRNGWVK